MSTAPPPPPQGATLTSQSTAVKRNTNKSFDISQLPSLKDGMSAEEEATKRRRTCRFLEEAGLRILKLPRVAVSTSMVFFHRFYAKHSFAEHDRFEVAVACLLLAAKTEESPRKLNTVISECYKLKNRGSAGRTLSRNSDQSDSASGNNGVLDPKGEEFLKLKERILLLERVILHTIGFELSVDHPYKFLVEQIKKMVTTRQVEYKTKVENATPSQFPAKAVASACVYLGGQMCKIQPVGDKTWFNVLGCSDADSFSSICVQIMEVIADKKGSSTEAFQAIRKNLEEMADQREGGAASERDAKRPRTG